MLSKNLLNRTCRSIYAKEYIFRTCRLEIDDVIGRYRRLSGAATAHSSAGSGKGNKKWGWILLLPTAFTGYLGAWQVNRYHWKKQLVQQREESIKEPALDLWQLPHTPAEFSIAAGKGEFLHEKSIFIGPRPQTVMGTANAGYVLITPFVSKEWNSAALVNRGWVPAEWCTDKSARARDSPTGNMQVAGVVRRSEPRGSFVPDNNPTKGEWYWINIPQIAAEAGLPPEIPLIEEFLENAGGERLPKSMDVLSFKGRRPKEGSLYPKPKTLADLNRVSVMPVDHRNYAITWFSLSGVTALLAFRALRRPPRFSGPVKFP